jgi:cytochrome c
MKRIALLMLLALVATAFVMVHAQREKEAEGMSPDEATRASIMRGKELFSDPGLGTNGKTCNECHTAGGTLEGKMGNMVVKPFHEVNEKYPRYWIMADKVMTLDQVINWCIMTPLQGEPLKWDDPKMTDLAAYCASIESPEMEPEDDDD